MQGNTGLKLPACSVIVVVVGKVLFGHSIVVVVVYQQTGQLDLRHFDPEFVREPVPGMTSLVSNFPRVISI